MLCVTRLCHSGASYTCRGRAPCAACAACTQVRHMAGALLAVGSGRLSVDQLARKLHVGRKEAPGQGGHYRGWKVADAKVRRVWAAAEGRTESATPRCIGGGAIGAATEAVDHACPVCALAHAAACMPCVCVGTRHTMRAACAR